MKKAFIAVIIASLFLTPAAFGIEEKFSDWVYAGDSLVIDEQSFSFKLSTSSMSVAHNDDLYIIGLGKCNGGELVKICLNDTNWDSLTDETSARISISFYKPVISITRTTKTPTVDVGEKINFDIDVLNTGDLDAKNVKYTDSFPKEIFIEKVSGACEKGENNSIISTGTLKRGNKISCTYIVIPKDVVDIKLKAQVDYFDGFKDEKTYSGLIDIKANAIFDINAFHKKSLYEDNVSGALVYESIDLDDLEIETGEEFPLHINLTNLVADKLDFEKFLIRIPKEMRVEKSNMEKTEGGYFWDGSLEENETKEFYFQITPKEGGNFELEYDVKLTKDKKVLEFENNKINYEIEQGAFSFISNLDDQTNFDSGKELFLVFKGKNTYNFTDLKDISVEIKSLLTLPINVPINFLEANTTSLIYKTTLLPAEITTSKSITFDAVVNYTTEFGVQKSEDEQWKITLKPLSDILIEKKISPSSVEEGDEVTITVSVKNTRSKPIYDIQLHEIVPEEISRNGKTSAVIEKLDDDEKQDAYEYTINAPKVKNETIITLNTSLTYSEGIGEEKVQQQGFAIIKSLDIKVKPKKLDLDIDKNIDKTKMYVGEIAKVTYSIENKDEETAYDLLFEFTKSKDVDLLEEYDYYLERLEPGELVSFDREVLRPKVDGKYVAGQTIVHFKDPDKNSFNYTISSPTIDVKERNLWGPGIILEKSFEKTSVDAGEIINVTITAQNVGDEEAFANIVDGQREWRVIVPVGKKKNITYKVRVFEAKDAQTDAFAYHDFQGKEYRAYAKSPGITVKALEAPVEDEEDLSGVVVAKTVKEKEAEQLRGFFKTFWEMLKSFIGIKKA